MQQWNVDPKVIAALAAKAEGDAEDDVVEIEPENVDAFRIFRQMLTQWNTQSIVAGNKLVTIKTGLNLAALPGIREELGIKPSPRTMEAIRLMEAEALTIHARRENAAMRRR